ncbi:hypothetical protein HBA54_23145 [Pelagibius litoralis]|uniref:Phosphatidate cytidylyltransferase n=1 Tax=Pelagibius litoralis TaxID=374515 RepID=A0A967KHP9_9PROT|nr:hypothetical protein [Pelagibius litoralis]NIA71491.1 hypothetical protein [Pelagibius litoralis]
MSDDDLGPLLRAEIAQPVGEQIAAIAAAAEHRHGAVAAVLFYGSCLRESSVQNKVVDLYLIVDSYKEAHGGRLSALFNRALPPNVYYLETAYGDAVVLRAKYAVCSLADFAAGAGGRWFHPYLWARFAQPSRLAYCRNEATRTAITAILARAARKMVEEGLMLMEQNFSTRDLWTAVFRETYRTELRAEAPDRADKLYDANQGYFEQVGNAVLATLRVPAAATAAPPAGPSPLQWMPLEQARTAVRARWLLRRAQGKLLSVLRLMKAAFTFVGGPDYLLWKIERHSGVAVTLTPWQRRHPILASSFLFWRLYRKGAFK